MQNLALIHIEHLYVYLQREFSTLVHRAKSNNALDSHLRPVDHLDLRGNVLEDMLVQITTQLHFATECLKSQAVDITLQSQVKEIVESVIYAVARASLLICKYAHLYLGVYQVSFPVF